MSTPTSTESYRAPWPKAWAPEPPHARAWRLLAFCVLFLALFVACTVSAVIDSDPAHAVLFGVGVLLFLALTAGFWVRQFRVRSRGARGITHDPDGMRLVIDFQRAAVWRLHLPRLSLSPKDVTLTYGRTVEQLAWTDVQLIRCGAEIKDFSIGVLAYAHGDRIRIPGDGLRADPALVAQLLEFYLEHGALRPELGKSAALDRVRDGRFVA